MANPEDLKIADGKVDSPLSSIQKAGTEMEKTTGGILAECQNQIIGVLKKEKPDIIRQELNFLLENPKFKSFISEILIKLSKKCPVIENDIQLLRDKFNQLQFSEILPLLDYIKNLKNSIQKFQGFLKISEIPKEIFQIELLLLIYLTQLEEFIQRRTERKSFTSKSLKDTKDFLKEEFNIQIYFADIKTNFDCSWLELLEKIGLPVAPKEAPEELIREKINEDLWRAYNMKNSLPPENRKYNKKSLPPELEDLFYSLRNIKKVFPRGLQQAISEILINPKIEQLQKLEIRTEGEDEESVMEPEHTEPEEEPKVVSVTEVLPDKSEPLKPLKSSERPDNAEAKKYLEESTDEQIRLLTIIVEKQEEQIKLLKGEPNPDIRGQEETAIIAMIRKEVGSQFQGIRGKIQDLEILVQSLMESQVEGNRTLLLILKLIQSYQE